MTFVTLGEVMMRLTPPNHQTFTQANTLDVHYGGAEANVAVGLAGFGVDTEIVTGLPKNDLGRAVKMEMHRHAVKTTHTVTKEGRLGTYYLEKGFEYRPSKVIYDRAGSVFSKLTADDLNLEEIFSGKSWFHFSGITPALNDKMFDLTLEAVKQAKANGLFISCDLNYRAALWPFDQARTQMSKLLPYVDLVFGYEPISLPDEQGNDLKDGLDRLESIENLSFYLNEIHQRYNIQYIAFTQRKNFSHSRNRLQGFISTPDEIVETDIFETGILDRVGTGDAFSTGVIYGLIEEWNLKETVQFGINNMLYKHSINGDFHTADVTAIQQISDSNSDIKR